MNWKLPPVALAAVLAALVASAQTGDADLDRGAHLVKQGEYGQAILVLDGAARRLAATPRQKTLAAQAYLNLGIAYVGEGQETLARASFREAITRDPQLHLAAFEVSPKVRDLFQKAKDEIAQQNAQAATTKKGGGPKTALIAVGIVALGGAGAAAALAGGGGDGDGSGNGDATTLVVQTTDGATRYPVGGSVQFAAQPNGSCTGSGRVTWSFGDGGTGTTFGGSVIAHTYTRTGTFTVAAVMECDLQLHATLVLTIV